MSQLGDTVKLLNPIYAAKNIAKNPAQSLLGFTAPGLVMGQQKKPRAGVQPLSMPAQSGSAASTLMPRTAATMGSLDSL